MRRVRPRDVLGPRRTPERPRVGPERPAHAATSLEVRLIVLRELCARAAEILNRQR